MIQKVKLHRGQILTKTNIEQYLIKARSGCDYCRFELEHDIYITIAFFKDFSYDIMTNHRSIMLWTDIQAARKTRSLSFLVSYIFRWIRQYNR